MLHFFGLTVVHFVTWVGLVSLILSSSFLGKGIFRLVVALILEKYLYIYGYYHYLSEDY